MTFGKFMLRGRFKFMIANDNLFVIFHCCDLVFPSIQDTFKHLFEWKRTTNYLNSFGFDCQQRYGVNGLKTRPNCEELR